MTFRAPRANRRPGRLRALTELSVANTQVSEGDLILVSNENTYAHPNPDALTSIFENKRGSYKCGDTAGLAEERALDAFNDMLDDFYAATGRGSVTVLYGYLTPEQAGTATTPPPIRRTPRRRAGAISIRASPFR